MRPCAPWSAGPPRGRWSRRHPCGWRWPRACQERTDPTLEPLAVATWVTAPVTYGRRGGGAAGPRAGGARPAAGRDAAWRSAARRLAVGRSPDRGVTVTVGEWYVPGLGAAGLAALVGAVVGRVLGCSRRGPPRPGGPRRSAGRGLARLARFWRDSPAGRRPTGAGAGGGTATYGSACRRRRSSSSPGRATAWWIACADRGAGAAGGVPGALWRRSCCSPARSTPRWTAALLVPLGGDRDTVGDYATACLLAGTGLVAAPWPQPAAPR